MSGDNVILIGMAGVGKSTIGVLLARTLGKEFIDTDLVIQKGEGKRLQDVLDENGGEKFLELERRYICTLQAENAVISTGGSVVHSNDAMEHLKQLGTVVLLEAPVEVLKTRVHNVDTRGLVMMGAKDLEELYRLREPMYRKWADLVVACDTDNHDGVVDRILEGLGARR